MTVNLILMIVGLLFLLVLLVGIYVWLHKKVPLSEPIIQPSKGERSESFETLCALIHNPASDAVELTHAAEAILERFGHFSTRSLSLYTELLEKLCVHPSTNSKLILKFEKTIRSNNPQFASEIDHALSRGLAARG